MIENHDTTSPADARAALASVTASESAVRCRSAWPFWLSILVAVSFGAYAVVRTYLGPGTALYVELAIVLSSVIPAFFLWLFFFRSRGLVVRDSSRWASAAVVSGLFVMDAHSGNYSGSAQAALVLGALNSMTILLVWGLADGLVSLRNLVRQRRRDTLNA